MTPQQKARHLRPYIEKAVISLTDEDALEAVDLFPKWEIDITYAVNERVSYNDVLYRCEQEHTSQADWTPDITPALWTQVALPGEGEDADHPIPYNNNMALEEGKYYSQNGVVYRCIRDTINPVYNNLADLVGIYVEVVT